MAGAAGSRFTRRDGCSGRRITPVVATAVSSATNTSKHATSGHSHVNHYVPAHRNETLLVASQIGSALGSSSQAAPACDLWPGAARPFPESAAVSLIAISHDKRLTCLRKIQRLQWAAGSMTELLSQSSNAAL